MLGAKRTTALSRLDEELKAFNRLLDSLPHNEMVRHGYSSAIELALAGRAVIDAFDVEE